MSQYLVLAENITYKNNKLSCINIYDRLSSIAMPAEFKFDLAIMCGPDWSEGEHNLTVKAKGSNGKEIEIGSLSVNIPSKDFVYNAFANDLKIIMDYSVESLTIVVYDNDKEIISRKYPVVSMFVPQKTESNAENSEEKKEEDKSENNDDEKKS